MASVQLHIPYLETSFSITVRNENTIIKEILKQLPQIVSSEVCLTTTDFQDVAIATRGSDLHGKIDSIYVHMHGDVDKNCK